MKEVYEILKDIYKNTDCIHQEEIIQEMKVLCKDILEKGGDIYI